MKPLHTLTAALLLSCTVAAAGSRLPRDAGETRTPATTPARSDTLPLPISTAWMYMSDDTGYDTIPTLWKNVDFRYVDVLYLGPAGVQSDGRFGLYNSPATGNLANRFRWILRTARTQNPNIKIVVSQWWGPGVGRWGSALDTLKSDAAAAAYAASVIDFLRSNLNVSGGVDGYDVDYESGYGGSNVTPRITNIAAMIRRGMTELSAAHGGRPFYLTVSPADTTYLRATVPSLDYVNAQTYAGGRYLRIPDYLKLGLRRNQLLYGICPETNCDTNPAAIDSAEAQYTTNRLAGIHLWRLNSDNYTHEDSVQKVIYDFLHQR